MKGKINSATISGYFPQLYTMHGERAAEIVCDVLGVDV